MYENAGKSSERIITEDEYILFSDLLDQRFGKKLKSGKMLTFHMKVAHRLAILGIETYREYYDHLVSDPECMEAAVLLSHLRNHHICSFRDSEQIKLLLAVLGEGAESHQFRRKKSLRLLSAPSAFGEEAYSLSAAMRSCGFSSPGWDVKIIGIDAAPKAICRAKEGWYNRDSFGAEASDRVFRTENFIVDGEGYIVKPCLREDVEFRVGNLVDVKSLAGLGTMDIIFCRHVLGSMTDSGIQRAVRNLFSLLSDDGYLFIGADESIIQHTNLFLPVHAGPVTVYRKNLSRYPSLAWVHSGGVLQQGAR